MNPKVLRTQIPRYAVGKIFAPSSTRQKQTTNTKYNTPPYILPEAIQTHKLIHTQAHKHTYHGTVAPWYPCVMIPRSPGAMKLREILFLSSVLFCSANRSWYKLVSISAIWYHRGPGGINWRHGSMASGYLGTMASGNDFVRWVCVRE